MLVVLALCSKSMHENPKNTKLKNPLLVVPLEGTGTVAIATEELLENSAPPPLCLFQFVFARATDGSLISCVP